jgi:hypothetical protein
MQKNATWSKSQFAAHDSIAKAHGRHPPQQVENRWITIQRPDASSTGFVITPVGWDSGKGDRSSNFRVVSDGNMACFTKKMTRLLSLEKKKIKLNRAYEV